MRRILDSPPSRELLDRSFEQIVIGGRVLIPFWMPRWDGELFDGQILVPAPEVDDTDLIAVTNLDVGFVSAMLADRGISWTAQDIADRHRRLGEALDTWNAVSGGRSFENYSVLMALRGVIGDGAEFDPAEVATWTALQAAYDDFKPVVRSVEDYRRVITASLNAAALSALPLNGVIQQALPVAAVESGEERHAFLKIACSELRRVPIGSTLKETLRITQSDAAAHLRSKLHEWTWLLRTRELSKYDDVIGEIHRARRELRFARALGKAGELTTVVGCSATAAAALGGELAAAAGVAATVAGTALLAGQKAVEFRNRWAMFAIP